MPTPPALLRRSGFRIDCGVRPPEFQLNLNIKTNHQSLRHASSRSSSTVGHRDEITESDLQLCDPIYAQEE
jgi:hypothetical protein